MGNSIFLVGWRSRRKYDSFVRKKKENGVRDREKIEKRWIRSKIITQGVLG